MLSERQYVARFLEWSKGVPKDHYLYGSEFVTNIEVEYDPQQAVPKRRASSSDAPNVEIDVVERDTAGRFHLWEAKTFDSKEWRTAKVIGQLMLYDARVSTMDASALEYILGANGAPPGLGAGLASSGFASWNILVVGGFGWELAAGLCPVAWDYSYISETYLRPGLPCLNTFHFFHTSSGFHLENLLRISAIAPETWHPDAYKAWLRANYPEFEGPGHPWLTGDPDLDDLFLAAQQNARAALSLDLLPRIGRGPVRGNQEKKSGRKGARKSGARARDKGRNR